MTTVTVAKSSAKLTPAPLLWSWLLRLLLSLRMTVSR